MRTGIGQDGYLRYQPEVTYNTPVTAAMILLPIKAGSLQKAHDEMIPNENVVASRLEQVPDRGRVIVPVQPLTMDYYPDLVGGLFHMFLGAASSVLGVAAYTHTWLVPISGERIAKSFTSQQAIGADLADQFNGCKIVALVIKGDTSGNLEIEIEVLPNSLTEDVARITTFTLPTTIPFNWSFYSEVMTPSGESAASIDVNSMELRIDLQYNLERYKFGSKNIQNPVFNSIPQTTLTMNIDAQKDFVNFARIHKQYDIDLTFTSTEDAAGSEKFQLDLELPRCILEVATEIPNDNDELNMDLAFKCSYGGVTTGSGADSVQAEIRIVDAVTAYA